MSIQSIEDFLNHHGVKANRFYGKCFKLNNGSLFMVDIISKEEGIYLIKDNGDREKVFATKNRDELSEGKYYEFSIHIVETDESSFAVVDTLSNPPKFLEKNPFKEIVDQRIAKKNNPESNKTIANLMQEIGKGLYSSKKRMVFELLQNADDSPAGDQVEFLIDAYEDYLLIMHNGIPFNKDDVEAITSAAESTKKKDRKKTGYKGIGFKSVFTDSEEVIIKSGSFLFSFDRHYEGFNSFDDFYFKRDRYIEYPKLLEEDKELFKKERQEFQGSIDLPWQLLPIWLENVPDELKESRFVQFNNNVGIAIKFGREKVEDYLSSVESIAKHAEFMLFLRHVDKFKSVKLGFTIEKDGDENVVVSHTTRNKNFPKQVFRKKEVLEIPVNEKALADEEVHIYKHKKTNEFGETEFYFSSDIEGRNRIETIPPKLAAAEETSISFAVPIINNNLQADERYLKGDTFLSFFTYLPMNEHRIQLPMFVNADFVPSSDRESLQGDNEWNIYIMAKIGTSHALWIAELANKAAEAGKVESQYLSLLLKKPLEEIDEVSALVKKYNQNYLNTLSSTPFVLTDTNEVQTKDAVILDNSNLSIILGNECFYKISGTQKRLPHHQINPEYLEYKYLNVEQFCKEELISKLKHVENWEFLRNAVADIHKEDYIRVLKWMNNLAKHSSLTSVWLNPLPFLRLNDGSILSLEEVHKSEGLLLNRKQLREVRDTLKNLGFRFTKFELDSYPNIYEKVPAEYTNDKTLFENISNSEKLGVLSSSDKAKLISFIQNLDGVGKEKYAENLSLFKDQSDSSRLKPLRQLISNSETELPSWLSHMKIDRNEEQALDSHFSAYLLTKKDLLQGLFCVPELYEQAVHNVNENNLQEFYHYLTELAEESEELSTGKTEIPWVYVPSKKSFHKSESVYLPDSLQKLDEASYQSVANVVESISDLMIPAFSSHSLIKALTLGAKSGEFTESIHSDGQIEKEHIRSFLSWLSDAKEKAFFTNFIIEESEKYYLLKKADRNEQYYTSSGDLALYIEERDEEQIFRFLPEELFSNGLEKAGLLTDENLFASLIDHNLSDMELVMFFEPHLGDNLFQKYLNSIDRIDIDTTKTYGADSVEAKVVELASRLVAIEEINVDSIRSKIYVDNHQLSDTAISDDIYFKERKYPPALKLSEVLTNYHDKTYSYSKICNIFPDKKELLNLIFKPKQLTPSEIHDKLSEIDQDILSPEQTLFMLMYAHDQNIADPFNGKSSFTAHFEANNLKYKVSASSFFDLFVRESEFKQAIHKLKFPDLEPEQTVLEPEYAIDSELPPEWFKAWIEGNGKEQKVQFTKSVGFNHADSAVVRLRKALLDRDNGGFDTARVELSNKQQFINTLLWLQKKQNNSDIKLDHEFLKALYKKAENLNCNLADLPIPVFKMNSHSDLSLITFNEETRFYVKQQSWAEYTDNIFSFLSTSNRFAVPDFLPEKFQKELEVNIVEPILELNKEKVSKKAIDFEEPFYQNWDRNDELKLLVYPEEKLPFNLIFDDKVLEEKDRENYFFISNSEVVISRSIKDIVPEIFRSDLNERGKDDLYNAFSVQKSDWDKQSEKNKEGINYSEDELKALKRLFEEDLPEDYKKNYNLAALVSGLVTLESLNYDVEKAYENLKNTHEYSQIEPVYKSEETFTVMCRSARQGLLYLTAQAWNRLDYPNIHLFADLGNRDYQLHPNKQSVLNGTDSNVEFQILRIESESDLSNIEDILSGHFDKEKIWIIFKVKAKTKFDPIFYKSSQPDNTSEKSTPPRSYSSTNPY